LWGNFRLPASQANSAWARIHFDNYIFKKHGIIFSSFRKRWRSEPGRIN
jgi:hypothetical protein